MDLKNIESVGARPTRRLRASLKGRTVDPEALAEVRTLLEDAPRQREHPHKIQDALGHFSAAHLAALAREMKMNLPLAKVSVSSLVQLPPSLPAAGPLRCVRARQ